MAHVGERLCQRRLAQNIDLKFIADETRISARYLEALEQGDWKQLPGSIFARSFARQYASLIGMDEAEIESDLQATFPLEDNVPQAETLVAARGIQVKPLPELAYNGSLSRWLQPLASFAAVMAVCSGIYVGWQRFISRPAERVDEARVSQQLPATRLPLPSVPVTALEATPEAVPASPAEAQPLDTTSVELRVPPGHSSGMSVRITASQKTWVSITANGQKLFRGILQPNEARQMAGVEKAKFVIGNAGGVEITTDGRPIGPIGPNGQVRVLVLTPEGPQIFRNTRSEGPTESESSQTE